LLNIASIEGAFKVENYNLSGQNWLTKEDINQKMELPLWYAGVFLLGL
jgi:hypothetical protein